MRIAIISDIHEDVESLIQAINFIETKAIDKIVCVGDIVGFSVPYYNYIKTRDASECINIIKANCEIVVAGNHDIYESKKIPIHNAGIDYPNNWYSLSYKEKKAIGKHKIWLYEKDTLSSLIDKNEINYLNSLPEYKIIETENKKILFSHFIYPDLLGTRADFTMSSNSFSSHINFLNKNECTLSFAGHGHFEGVCNFNGKTVNVKTFGILNIKNGKQAFIGPCIACGKQANGFVIFDSKEMVLDVISLQQKKITKYFFKKA